MQFSVYRTKGLSTSHTCSIFSVAGAPGKRGPLCTCLTTGLELQLLVGQMREAF